MCDQWCSFSNATLEPQQQSSFYHRFIYPDDMKNPKEVERAQRNLSTKLETLSEVMGNKKFLVGNEFTIADVSLTYVLNWIGMSDSIEYNNIVEYVENHKKRKAFPKEYYQ